MEYPVKQFGAVGDGRTLDTEAIQAAIDACAKTGGRVVLEAGVFLTGTLYMRSHVELYVDISATLLGSGDIRAYTEDTYVQLYRFESHTDKCLIYCDGLEDIAFTGHGVIDGNGGCFSTEEERGPVQRPMLLRYRNCRNIRLSGLRLVNPASWTNDFIACCGIWVHGVSIRSRANWNGDGLDFNACEDVFVSSCLFDCSDDCICLQNSEEDRVCKNVVVSDCIFCSQWAGMRIGVLNCGDIENLTVSNCIFRDIACSALKIQSAEGGHIRNLLFDNLLMENVQRPLFITENLYRERIDRPEEVTTHGTVTGVTLQHVRASSTGEKADPLQSCIVLDALHEGGIGEISLSDFSYTVQGGGTKEDAARDPLPTHEGKRAECFNYAGPLPAYGIFSRNVQTLRLRDFRVTTLQPDERELLYGLNSGVFMDETKG